MTSPPPSKPALGRPNQIMSKVVYQIQYLFNRGQRQEALALAHSHQVPLHVLERVVLRRGPRRKHNAQQL